MHATIFSLDVRVPEKVLTQEEFLTKTCSFLNLSEAQKEFLERLAVRGGVQKRHTVLTEFLEEEGFYGKPCGKGFPSTKERNILYMKEAPALAEVACKGALAEWGGSVSDITHVISVSCTGMMAPGIEFLLIEKLGLSKTVERLGINFMGCFGAFKALAIARSLALMNPQARILIVCTELCSLHFSKDPSKDTWIGNALFGDGSAAAVIGINPRSYEKPLLELHNQASEALSNTQDLMTWETGDFGYQMRLSPAIPGHFEAHIAPFAKRILGDIPLNDCAWAIHPGGKSILNAIVKACAITKEHCIASWSVLNNFGNMSSPTFLFVLKEILQSVASKEWIIGLGFGPGLSVEGVLLKRVAQYVAK